MFNEKTNGDSMFSGSHYLYLDTSHNIIGGIFISNTKLADKMAYSDESNDALKVDFWITEVSVITSCKPSIIFAELCKLQY